MAEIRTLVPLEKLDFVKDKNHDCSMINHPESWLFVDINGIFYPYIIA